MKSVSVFFTLAILAGSAVGVITKLPARGASEKTARWVDYITYDGTVTSCVRVLMKRDLTHTDVPESQEAASEFARRWVDYITYDGIVASCVHVLMKRGLT